VGLGAQVIWTFAQEIRKRVEAMISTVFIGRLGVSALLAACCAALFSLCVGLARADETEAKAIELGKQRYGENCSGFCHGAGGRGGRAPCIVCGKFKRGATDEEILKNITEGIAGTPMGAFGDKLSKEDIAAVLAYMRAEQKKKEAEAQ
jgi:mono/diheme cytochrome c family protein